MIRIYLAAVDVVPAAVVLIPLFLILYGTVYKRNLRKTILYCIFSLYLAATFSLVGIPNIKYVRPALNLNLIPFQGIVADLKNSLLNIALFVPLGFFLPILWERFRKLLPAMFFGLGLSLLIELLQVLTFRATDVNDLIMNVFGTAIGFQLTKSIIDRSPAVEEDGRDVFILCTLSFCVMFFIHPFLSPMIWDRIL